MKRIGGLYERICAPDNLYLADRRARRGKADQHGVEVFDRDPDGNLWLLNQWLYHRTYRTSPYKTFTIREPKERLIFALPYFPDRITHHAILNVTEPIFRAHFTADTFSCIRGRGIHGALRKLRTALLDQRSTTYCLKMDIKKFYPSIDHEVLKGMLRRKFKDRDLLWLMDEIIDSAPGLPIGNYLSQFFGNFYLSPLDHWLKEEKRVRHCFRYMDDIVILSPDKPSLHRLLAEIREYLAGLRLQVKHNYQIFPVDARGIDFVGYRAYHTHVLLRKGIKKRLARMMALRPNRKSIASYNGWAAHCDSLHLLKTLNRHAQRKRVLQLR